MAFWNDPSSLFPKQAHRWVISLGDHLASDQINSIPHYFAKSVDRPSYKIDTVQAKYLYAHTFNFPKRLIWNPIKIEFNDILITEKSHDSYFQNFIEEPKISPGNTKNIVPKDIDNLYETIQDRSRKITETIYEDVENQGPVVVSSRETKQKVKLRLQNLYKKSTQLFFYQFLQKCGYDVPNELDLEDQLLRYRSYHFKKNMIGALNGKELNLLDNNSDQYNNDYIAIKELDENGNVIEFWKVFNPIITDVSTGKLDYSTDNILSITVGISYDWAELVPSVASKQRMQSEDNRLKLELLEHNQNPDYEPPNNITVDRSYETKPGKEVQAITDVLSTNNTSELIGKSSDDSTQYRLGGRYQALVEDSSRPKEIAAPRSIQEPNLAIDRLTSRSDSTQVGSLSTDIKNTAGATEPYKTILITDVE